MTKVIELALLRIGDLWPEWISSRHVTREIISGTIALNVLIIIRSNAADKIALMSKCAHSFPPGLKKQVLNHLKRLESNEKYAVFYAPFYSQSEE